MDIVYWFAIAYVLGTVIGWYFGRTSGLAYGVATTVDLLVANGFLKTRQDENGDLDLVKLTLEEKLNDSTKSETD
jgi:hypothetical protein